MELYSSRASTALTKATRKKRWRNEFDRRTISKKVVFHRGTNINKTVEHYLDLILKEFAQITNWGTYTKSAKD